MRGEELQADLGEEGVGLCGLGHLQGGLAFSLGMWN